MIIDYKITGKCNADCGFCWDFCKGIPEQSISMITKAFEKLIGIIDMISLTGGEPLIVRDIDKIIMLLKDMGFKIYLSTNGMMLYDHIETVAEYVNILGLPIDSINPKTQSAMGRNTDLIDSNLNNLIQIKELNPNIITKVGTVASRINYKEIGDIGDAIFNLKNPVDSWRVYQFTQYGKACLNTEKYSIDDDIFMHLCNALRAKYKNRVSFLSSSQAKDSYWFITPNLRLARLTDNNYEEVGSIFSMDRNNIEELLENEIIIQNSRNNRKHIYE